MKHARAIPLFALLLLTACPEVTEQSARACREMCAPMAVTEIRAGDKAGCDCSEHRLQDGGTVPQLYRTEGSR